MKVELTDVSDTQKSLAVEIPSDIVDSEIERVTRGYARSVKLPGFRPGKIPAKVVRQRFKAQILHEVAHELIPSAVDSVLRERGMEPIETPSVRDVSIEEGQPLKFTAAFETTPPVDVGPLTDITLRRPPVSVDAEQIDNTIERLRQGQARVEPVEGRGAARGDSVVMNMTRRKIVSGEEASGAEADRVDSLEDVTVEIGEAGNPPGFDEQLEGLEPGAEKTFRVTFPADYPVESLAGAEVEYAVRVSGVRQKALPALDEEFARDLGYESLDELREQIRGRLEDEAVRRREREVRQDLLRQLARRVTFDVPEALVSREIDRRMEDFVQQLAAQRVDPRQINVDWQQFRDGQREAAVETVKCAIVLDEIARREDIHVRETEVEAEIARYAEAAGQPADAVRQRLARDGAIGRIYTGLRRERAIDYVLGRATILEV
jgi:trigger factor